MNLFHTMSRLTRRGLGAVLIALWATQAALAGEIRVVTSGAFTEAYKQLVPLYEAATGHKVISSYGASIGNAPDSIPSRFARGEAF
ncbi:MAG TPA: ABC transporter substrate-binding protein, partial [Burkholderiaceae bacterium]|nr:ABC transporter substrate-binding protein [Burkholderiaceae bacterium]